MAHFFIDSERFPILDGYAVSVIKLHLGRADYNSEQGHPYVAYVANFQKLKQRAGWMGTSRELDHYLWIAGQYMAFLRNQNGQINTELRHLFEFPPPGVRLDIGLIAGIFPK